MDVAGVVAERTLLCEFWIDATEAMDAADQVDVAMSAEAVGEADDDLVVGAAGKLLLISEDATLDLLFPDAIEKS